MADVLETCPFCGQSDLEPDWTCALVRCRTCQAEGPVVESARTSEARRAAAIAAWNRRATPPDDLRAELVARVRHVTSALLQLPTGPLSAYTRQHLFDLFDLKGLCAALDRMDAAGEGRGT